MRYPANHALHTYQRILSVACEAFRERGFDGISLNAILSRADFTVGGFYKYFASKDALATKATMRAAAERTSCLREHMRKRLGVAGHIAAYLSNGHRDHAGEGCQTAALGSEIGRQSAPVRRAFTAGIDAYVTQLAAQMPELPPAQARGVAIALHALMAGAVQLARASDDPAFSAEILEAARTYAMAWLP
jgi:TetR/AcrR family transcriptional regulator, transcriptional repressor for nem operon